MDIYKSRPSFYFCHDAAKFPYSICTPLATLLIAIVVSACTTVGGASPGASVDDTPTHGPVGRTMKKFSEKFAACGRDSVTVQTGTTQRLKLHFQVDQNGRVQNPKITSMSGGDPDLYNCVVGTLRRIEFPPPSDHQAKSIIYPLTLRPE